MQPAAGVLMVASPMLVDPHFQQTVVLLLEHGVTGSMGVIINRPATWTLGELWESCPDEISDQRLACEGGPVDQQRGMLLHNGDKFPATQRILPGVAVGGDISAIVAAGGSVRLFLGHAGWDAEQLQQEIRHGYWLLLPGDGQMALSAGADVSWWEELVQQPAPLERPGYN